MTRRLNALQAILLGGAIGAVGDILYAIGAALLRGDTATHLLQIVASGMLGEAAFDGGTGTAGLGLALHFLLSWLWAAMLFLLLRRRPYYVDRFPLPVAVACGVLVFLVMRLVVLPLSAFPYPSGIRLSWSLFGDLLSHIFLFALPIVLATRRVFTPEQPTAAA